MRVESEGLRCLQVLPRFSVQEDCWSPGLASGGGQLNFIRDMNNSMNEISYHSILKLSQFNLL